MNSNNMRLQQTLWRKQAQKCISNLRNHGFSAAFFETKAEAAAVIIDKISKHKTFGFGGSDTLRELGLPQKLRDLGKTIYDHWAPDLSMEQQFEVRKDQGRCDCFLCSANAVSITGEIINIDGIGNRTSAMAFGPRQVVIVAGMNKTAPDMESALKRARRISGPMRANSLNMETPCCETGICSDCNSERRICRITTILHRRPSLTDILVVLINEDLGF